MPILTRRNSGLTLPFALIRWPRPWGPVLTSQNGFTGPAGFFNAILTSLALVVWCRLLNRSVPKRCQAYVGPWAKSSPSREWFAHPNTPCFSCRLLLLPPRRLLEHMPCFFCRPCSCRTSLHFAATTFGVSARQLPSR